jgi:hypothetical protein
MLKRFAVWVSTESAVIMWGLQALVTAWVAFGFRASPAQTAATTTIGAAIVTIITAFAARPVSVPVITGAVATAATASAAFGLHLSAAQIGAGVPVLSLVLSLVLRQAVTPLVTLRRQQEATAPVVHHHARLDNSDVEAIATRLADKVRTARQPRTPRTM